MTIFASNKNKGFYDDSIHLPDQIPSDAVEISREKHQELLEGQSSGLMINFDVADGEAPTLIERPVEYNTVEQYSEMINTQISGIYDKYFRFETEYTTREAAAKAYKEAGYEGDVSVWVSSFANAAGMEVKAATDLILSQSIGLRTALEQLGCLRMRKYELIGLEGETLAAKHKELSDAVNVIAAGLN